MERELQVNGKVYNSQCSHTFCRTFPSISTKFSVSHDIPTLDSEDIKSPTWITLESEGWVLLVQLSSFAASEDTGCLVEVLFSISSVILSNNSESILLLLVRSKTINIASSACKEKKDNHWQRMVPIINSHISIIWFHAHNMS